MDSQSFASRWPCTLQRFSRVSDFELAEDAKELLCDNGLPRFFQINSARFEFVNTWVSLAEATDSQHVLDIEMSKLLVIAELVLDVGGGLMCPEEIVFAVQSCQR